MSADEPIFKGQPSQLTAIEIDAPIAHSRGNSLFLYASDFGQAAHTEADEQKAAAYAFLQVLTGFMDTFDKPREPYSPAFIGGEHRSPIPSDLTESDDVALKALAPLAHDPALRARLYDVLWLRTKEVAAGHEAVKAYLAAAASQNNPDRWVYAISSFQRALQLAAAFGRRKPLFREILQAVETAAKEAAASPKDMRPLKLMRLLLATRATNPADFVPLAAQNAAQAEKDGDLPRARAYREHEGEWLRFAGKKAESSAAQLAAARIAIRQAEARATGPNASALAAARILGESAELLQRAGAPREEVEAARRRMAELQEAAIGEMQTFSTSADISDAVKRAEELVHCPDFFEALQRFVLAAPLSKPTEIKKTIAEIAQKNPISHLMASSLVDSKGRVIAKTPALLGSKGEEAEAALRARIIAHAAQFLWHHRVCAHIEPARAQIRNDHHPRFDDLLFLVLDNPFVPPGHEGIYLRGIHAGFHGDFLEATHLLVPQIENSLRYLLESRGVDVSVYKADGTQPVKILGGLLGLPQTEKILGEDLVFELQGCLIEKSGFDLRNRVAHGFMSEADCYSDGPIFIWWHVVRICLFPIMIALAKSSPSPPSPPKEQSADGPQGTPM